MRPTIARSVLRALPRPALQTSLPPRAVIATTTSSLSIDPTRQFSSSSFLSKKNKGPQPKSPQAKIRAHEDDEASETADSEGAGEVVIEEVVGKAKTKMEKAVHWARAVIFEGVERGRGRVTPALLDSVRVDVPDMPGSSHLNTVASVTSKGNTLFVEVYDTSYIKPVESAIHSANLPGISPQRMSESTLKIPIARPTVEQRAEILKSLHDTVEAAKQQIRTARTDGFRALGGRKANGTDDVQKVVDEMVKDLEGQLVAAKKEFEKA
ncbi:hypothetical protein CI109_100514 [Kwoniella shandongensis]|uniref:Ribosome recycling factor domain-containing protein n=1 Tax=Kwoniella shandongensis TaxID=1734106 RepID=A0A5M6BNN1_9TREE|nr:uncharacterized protein CI109_007354 [Kwoniella shandongensis]KAA5524307.1 hypothetical protein CI109_007354 [Kwoniella shandongensis]